MRDPEIPITLRPSIYSRVLKFLQVIYESFGWDLKQRFSVTNLWRHEKKLTTCLVWWLARLSVIQDVPGSIPGYTLQILLEV